jgi:hypothetical protein
MNSQDRDTVMKAFADVAYNINDGEADLLEDIASSNLFRNHIDELDPDYQHKLTQEKNYVRRWMETPFAGDIHRIVLWLPDFVDPDNQEGAVRNVYDFVNPARPIDVFGAIRTHVDDSMPPGELVEGHSFFEGFGAYKDGLDMGLGS